LTIKIQVTGTGPKKGDLPLGQGEGRGKKKSTHLWRAGLRARFSRRTNGCRKKKGGGDRDCSRPFLSRRLEINEEEKVKNHEKAVDHRAGRAL